MTSPPRRLAAVLALGVLALGATACSEEVPDRDSSGESEATDPTSPSVSDPPTETPTESEGTEPEGTATVPVYFVGDTPRGPRLFREFHAVPGDNPLLAAAALVTAGDTIDPDYRTLWPLVEISDVQPTDGVLLVKVAGDGFTERPDGMSKQTAKLAIQQLVYTLQGVQQERVPVQFERERGFPLFGLSTDAGYASAPQLDLASLVNVTTPEHGATVTGDTLSVSGVASSFEATVPWEIRLGDEVVLDGFATADGWVDKLYPWETEIDISGLEPGTYRFIARTDDPSGGAEGAGPDEDTKEFVLE